MVYRPINGGSGQVYDLVYLLLCRGLGKKIFIHHHSFNYLNKRSGLFSLLSKIAGKNAIHIALGDAMKVKLIEHYNLRESNVLVLSNLAFFEPNKVNNVTVNEKVCIGHLANLCTDKGVDTFIGICRLLKKNNIDFSAKIAGPFADTDSKALVMKAIDDLSEIQYLGPLYNQDKVVFYQSLDCFIFPSKYKNEAEPLVLYEAAMWGSLLLGTKRGCMNDVITKLNGVTVNESAESEDLLANNIIKLNDTHSFSSIEKEARINQFNSEYSKAIDSLNLIIDKFQTNEISRPE
jgi:glycosyltransferase involved in cell wall biosynthesis